MTDTPRETPDDLRARLIQKLREPVDHGGHDGWGSDGLHLSAADAIEAESMRADTAMTLLTAWQKRTYESEARETVLLAECDTLRAQLAALQGCDGNCACAVWHSVHEAATALYKNMDKLKAAEAQLAAREGEIATLTTDDVFPAIENVLDKHCRGRVYERTTRANVAALLDRILSMDADRNAKLASAEARADTAEAQLRAQEESLDELRETCNEAAATGRFGTRLMTEPERRVYCYIALALAPPITKESQP